MNKLFEQYFTSSKNNISLLGFFEFCFERNSIKVTDRKFYFQAYKDGLLVMKNKRKRRGVNIEELLGNYTVSVIICYIK